MYFVWPVWLRFSMGNAANELDLIGLNLPVLKMELQVGVFSVNGGTRVGLAIKNIFACPFWKNRVVNG